MKPTEVNWSQIYDEEFSKLPEGYISQRLEIKQNSWNPSAEYHPTPTSTETFCKLAKEHFDLWINSELYVAFESLHSEIPMLAERLIVKAYKENLLRSKLFCDCFRRIYLWTHKGPSLFNSEISYRELLSIFAQHDFKVTMDDEELEILKNLPKRVNVYRGTAGKTLEESKAGVSWSLKRSTAVEFAQHDQKWFETESNLVIDAIVLKSKILALYDSRSEMEVIVDPTNIVVLNAQEEGIPEDNPHDNSDDREIPEPNFEVKE